MVNSFLDNTVAAYKELHSHSFIKGYGRFCELFLDKVDIYTKPEEKSLREAFVAIVAMSLAANARTAPPDQLSSHLYFKDEVAEFMPDYPLVFERLVFSQMHVGNSTETKVYFLPSCGVDDTPEGLPVHRLYNDRKNPTEEPSFDIR